MIIIFSITDSLGGAEQLLFKLAKFYKREERDVMICFLGSKTNSIWEGAGFSVFYCQGSLFTFFKFLKGKQFNLTLSSHLMMNALLGLSRTLGFLKTDQLVCRESTTVFERYNGIKLLKYKFAYWMGYRKIDAVITQSDLMRDILLRNLPYLERRFPIQTIPNLFEYPKHEIISDKKYCPYIVSAGRLIPEKGFDLLIEAFKVLKETYPNYKLVILGEGKEREKLQQLIIDLEFEEEVFLPGFVDDVYPYFKGAELCVVSSRIEGFPNVLLQMMSQNNKVVSTLCAGGIELLEGVKTCVTNDVDVLRESIISILLEESVAKREIFDRELKQRSIEEYVSKLNKLNTR